MRKNGFTLAEILGVIVIVGLLLILTIPMIINRLKGKENDVDEASKALIYEAAGKYIDDNSGDYPGKATYCISVSKLIKEGKLSDPVLDVKTGQPLNNYSVKVIVFLNGQIEYELMESGCTESRIVGNITFSVSPKNKWVNSFGRTVTITYPDGGTNYTYRVNNGASKSAEKVQEVVFNKNGYIYAEMDTNNGHVVSKKKVGNIDITKPEISIEPNGSSEKYNNKEVEVIATDDESGISAQSVFYAWSNSNSVEPSNYTETSLAPINEHKVSSIVTAPSDLNGNYYLWIKKGIKDNVDNETDNYFVSEAFKLESVPATKTVTVTFAKGLDTSSVGATSRSCTIQNNNSSCTVVAPAITSNNNYLASGFSRTKTPSRGVMPNGRITVTDDVTYYGNSAYGVPTFKEDVEGEVVISFPLGCSSPYTCKYKIGNGSEVSVSTSSVTVNMGEGAVITATASDGSNVVSSTYTSVRHNLYVKSSGSDTTGYGTVKKPYATITKAYNSATASGNSIIYVMDNITQNDQTYMNGSKNITITSSNVSGVSGSVINTVTRANSFVTGCQYVLKNGTLTIKNIKFNGNNVSADSGAFQIRSTFNINSGSEIYNFKSTKAFGGAIHTDKIDNTFPIINFNAGSIHDNQAPAGGVINLSSIATLNISGGFFSGNSVFSSDISGSGTGGAIYNNGTLNITGGSISNNKSSGKGGAIFNAGTIKMTGGSITNNEATGDGGGIYTTKILNITGSINVNNNSTKGSGGGIFASRNSTDYVIDGVNVRNNSASAGGGGIFIENNITSTINNSTITDNTATHGGGIWSGNSANVSLTNTSVSNNKATYGGAIHNDSNLTITNSNIIGNTASCSSNTCHSGGIFSSGSLKISGGKVSENKITGGDGGGIFVSKESPELVIEDVEISKNSASAGGGGIFIQKVVPTTIKGCTITENSATHGGGIWSGENTSVSLINTSVSNNNATFGGAIHNHGNLKIDESEISSNAATKNSGGVYNSGSLTVSGGKINSNKADESGGAIFSDGGSTLTLENGVEIKSNEALNSIIWNSGTFNMKSATISNNKSAHIGTISNHGTANIEGGSITKNTCNTLDCGGAIYTAYDHILNLKEGNTVTIEDNRMTASMVYSRYLYSNNFNIDGKINDYNTGYWHVNCTNTYVFVRANNTNFVLDVAGRAVADKTNVGLWSKDTATDCVGEHSNCHQQWKVLPYKLVDGTMYYVLAANYPADQTLNNFENKNENGNNVITYHWDSFIDGSLWKIESDGSGLFYLKSYTGNRCLDVFNGTIANGTNVDIYSCNQQANQKWAFEFAREYRVDTSTWYYQRQWHG